MEFIAGATGPIIFDPQHEVSPGHIEDAQAALDFLRANTADIAHLKQMAGQLGRTGLDTVITLLNVTDSRAALLAQTLQPDLHLQRLHEANRSDTVVNLAYKAGIPEFLENCGYQTTAQLLARSSELMVVVLNTQVSIVIPADADFL